jgi:hypothetical protein
MFGITLISNLWPGGYGSSTPRIDVWSMNKKQQVFGYWENGAVAGPNCPPKKTIVLPILENGNFPHNPPSRKFYKWLGHCVKNPEDLCFKKYEEKFKKEPKKKIKLKDLISKVRTSGKRKLTDDEKDHLEILICEIQKDTREMLKELKKLRT